MADNYLVAHARAAERDQECFRLEAEIQSLRAALAKSEEARETAERERDEYGGYLDTASTQWRTAEASLSQALARIEELEKALKFADDQAVKVEALLEPHVKWECASEGCGKPAKMHFVRGGVGSYYCLSCYMAIQALPATPIDGGKG
jgi:hypothetical protein